MTLDTWFEGDPESCWHTADRLTRLARTAEDAGAFLVEQATLPRADFDGWSGNNYRASATRLASAATDGAATQRALAAGLGEFATNLEGVRRVLRRARSLAREHLVIHGLMIQEPGPYANERQREVFDLVRGAVEEARRIEHQAHRDWQTVLATRTGTPAPAPLAGEALPVPLDPMPQPEPDPDPDPDPDPGRGRTPDDVPPVDDAVVSTQHQSSTTTSATTSATANTTPNHGLLTTSTGTSAHTDDDWADALSWASPTVNETPAGTPTPATPMPISPAMATCGAPTVLGEVHDA